MNRPRVHIFWLFGHSGAGKSTLAGLLAAALREQSHPVLRLDGDEMRMGLCHGLGFSDSDRSENLRRSAEVAKLAVNSGLSVVASFITPLESHRQLVARILNPNLSLIHISASLEICRARDVKGLYLSAQSGLVAQMTGVTSPFEKPPSADLTLPTSALSVEESARTLISFARARLSKLR